MIIYNYKYIHTHSEGYGHLKIIEHLVLLSATIKRSHIFPTGTGRDLPCSEPSTRFPKDPWQVRENPTFLAGKINHSHPLGVDTRLWHPEPDCLMPMFHDFPTLQC